MILWSIITHIYLGAIQYTPGRFSYNGIHLADILNWSRKSVNPVNSSAVNPPKFYNLVFLRIHGNTLLGDFQEDLVENRSELPIIT